MKYNVGDKVKIRSWEDMEKQFGLDSDGDIRTIPCFSRLMKKYCGKIMTVSEVDSGDYHMENGGWFYFVAEMFEPVNVQKIVITTDGVQTLARLYDGKTVIKSATAKCSPDDTFDFATGAKLAFERLIGEEKKEQEWRVVNRPARVGDYVRITKKIFSFNEIGDILKVESLHDKGIFVRGSNHPRDTGDDKFGWYYCAHHFEVVEPCKKPETPKYYNGKVVCVSYDIDLTVGKIYEFIDGKLIDDAGDERPCPARPKERTKRLDEGWACGKFIPFVE